MEVLDIIIDPLGEIRAALAELGRSSRKISGVFFYYVVFPFIPTSV